jgi:hypothetical protein
MVEEQGGFGHCAPRMNGDDYRPKAIRGHVRRYFDATVAGGFQGPFPGGKIGGGLSFGQYRRITR